MSVYSDSSKCSYCGNFNDPLQLCDCPDALSNFIQRRGMPQSGLVVSTLRAAGKKIRALEAEKAAHGVVLGGWQLHYAGREWVSREVYKDAKAAGVLATIESLGKPVAEVIHNSNHMHVEITDYKRLHHGDKLFILPNMEDFK